MGKHCHSRHCRRRYIGFVPIIKPKKRKVCKTNDCKTMTTGVYCNDCIVNLTNQKIYKNCIKCDLMFTDNGFNKFSKCKECRSVCCIIL